MHLGILNLVDECLVIHLSTPAIVHSDVPAPTIDFAVDTEVAIPLGLRITADHLVVHIVFIGDTTVALHEDFLTCLRVDAERGHCPDGIHRASLVVFHLRSRSLVLHGSGVLRLVPCAQRVRDLLQLVHVVSSRSKHVHIVAATVVDPIVQIEFHTLVLCFTEVSHISGETSCVGHRDIGHHTFRAGHIVVETTRQAVVEQCEVETEVRVVLLLPLQHFVSQTGDIRTDAAVVGTVAIVGEGGHGVIRRETLRACVTIRGTELQAVHPRDVLHECLVVDVPTGTHRPERAPAVVLTGLGRTHQAIVGIEEVALGKRVVQREQSTAVARDAFRAVGFALLCILHAELDVVHEVVGEAFCHEIGAVILIVAHRQLTIRKHQVLIPLLRPLQTEVGRDVGVAAVHLGVGTLAEHIGGVQEVGVVGRFELIACGVLVDDTETAGELQLFVDVPLQIEVVRNGGIARLVERVQRGVIDGVVVSSRLTGVVHVAIALDEVPVHVVESAIGIHLVVLVEGSPRRVVTVVIVYGELVAELQVLHTVGERDATGEVVAVGAFHRTTYSIIHQVHAILHGLVATLQI